MLETIAEHTIETDLLTPGGFVLDAGCRNFNFAKELTQKGCYVLAIDADPSIEGPSDVKNLLFQNFAISHDGGDKLLLMHDNPEARHLVLEGVSKFPRVKVPSLTIQGIMSRFEVPKWDAVKLDIEGAEYEILKSWPGPISKQISIEFHEHCGRRDPKLYDQIFEHLGKWYRVMRHVLENKHCAGPNYWDTLLVEK